MRIWRLAPLLFFLGACGSDLDDRPASFSYITTAILVPNCATSGCHSRNVAAGGLRLDNRLDAYQTLVKSKQFVVPNDPDGSMLMKLLHGQDTWRMPPDQPLPDADIQLIARWIEAGALND